RAGIYVSLAEGLGQVGAVGDRNDPAETLPLTDVVVDADSIGSLYDARDTAERPGLQQHRKIGSETALRPASILRSVGAIHTIEVVIRRPFIPARRNRSRLAAGRALQQRFEVFLLAGDPLLRFRRERRDSAI